MPQQVAEQITVVVLSLLFVVMTGCGGAQSPTTEAPPTFGAGLTMRYDYRSTHGTSVFEIEVVDDRRLLYRGVAGEVTGIEGADGRVTAQVVDLLHLEVHSIEVSSEGERVELDGKIEIVRAAR